MANTKQVEIALYGNREIGFDFLATPDCGASFVAGGWDPASAPRYQLSTQALWAAQDALVAAGYDGADVAICAPSGRLVSHARIGSIPSFGSLAWCRAPIMRVRGAAADDYVETWPDTLRILNAEAAR